MEKLKKWISGWVARCKLKVKSWLEGKETWLFYGTILTVGIFLTWFTYTFFILFSDFGLIMIFLAICIAIYHLYDKLILIGINTLDELKKGNIAVGLALVAFALIIMAGAITVG